VLKIVDSLLLPLMLVNLTVAENRWIVFGLRPDQLIYLVTIIMAWYAVSRSRYHQFASVLLIVAIALRGLEILLGNYIFRELSFLTLAIIFMLAGAIIYGTRPSLLQRQLVVYLAICIPIMLLQVLGSSSLVMGWNIGYLHDPTVMTLEEVGSFLYIEVYPTLFVGPDDLTYSIGQGRPVGLMYAANALSIFISVAIAINFAIKRTSRIRASDVVVALVMVLAMSRLSFGVALVVYCLGIVFPSLGKRGLAIKLIFLSIGTLLLYFIFFPGLFLNNFSEGMMMSSLMLRLADLANALGVENFFPWIMDLRDIYRPSIGYVIEKNYSSIAMLLRSDWAALAVVSLGVLGAWYASRISRTLTSTSSVYAFVLLAAVMTQFAVPFLGANAFQVILGFALFPVIDFHRVNKTVQNTASESV